MPVVAGRCYRGSDGCVVVVVVEVDGDEIGSNILF